MDKIINSHIDNVEEIEKELDKIIEQEIADIDIKAIMADPKSELERVVENIRQIFIEKYAEQAVELGFDLGRIIQKKIEQDKTIKVDDSKDPNLNDDGTSNKPD